MNMRKIFVGFGVLVILFGAISLWYFSRSTTPPTSTGNFPSTGQTNTSSQPTSTTPPAPTENTQTSATLDQSSLTSNSNTPTISGTFTNTYGIEVVITTAKEVPQSNLLYTPVPGMVWADRSDHGGGVELNGLPSGTFSDSVTNSLPNGTYTVGIYVDQIYYPQTDENLAKDTRQLLTSAPLTIQTGK